MPSSELHAPHVASPILEPIVGPTPRPRVGFLDAVMRYVHTEGLQDPRDPRLIRTNARLQKVCGGKRSVSFVELAPFIAAQLSPAPPGSVVVTPRGSVEVPPEHDPVIQRLLAKWSTGPTLPPLVPLDPAHVADLNVDAQTQTILCVLGLPGDVSPALSLAAHWTGALPRMSAMNFDGGYAQRRLGHLRKIGRDACGDPICLDEANDGAVVLLDAESGFTARPMNSGLPELLESLVAYDVWASEKHRRWRWLERALEAVDPRAHVPGSFWANEVEDEKAHA